MIQIFSYNLRIGDILHNDQMHTDRKKRRSFLALLFAADDVGRYFPHDSIHIHA